MAIKNNLKQFLCANLSNFLHKYNFNLNEYLGKCFGKKWWRFFHELLDIYQKESLKISDEALIGFAKRYACWNNDLFSAEFKSIYFSLFEYSWSSSSNDLFQIKRPSQSKSKPTQISPESKLPSESIPLDSSQNNPQPFVLFDMMPTHIKEERTKKIEIKNEFISPMSLDNYENEPKWTIMKYASNQHLLNYIKASGQSSLIEHPTTRIYLKQKWQNFPRTFFYGHLLLFVVFLGAYSVQLEMIYENRDEEEIISKNISLFFSAYFFIYEIIHLIIKWYSKGFIFYVESPQNLLKLFTYPLCLATLLIDDVDVKTSLYAIAIILAYMIFILRLEKIRFVGIYVTVIKKIFKRFFSAIFIFYLF